MKGLCQEATTWYLDFICNLYKSRNVKIFLYFISYKTRNSWIGLILSCVRKAGTRKEEIITLIFKKIKSFNEV